MGQRHAILTRGRLRDQTWLLKELRTDSLRALTEDHCMRSVIRVNDLLLSPIDG